MPEICFLSSREVNRQNEEELISGLKQGNSPAFKELIDLFGSMVFNTSLGILQNKEDAEDIVQEVFLQVFASIGHFQGESKLSTWLYRIAMTKSLEFLRRKKRKKRFAFLQGLFNPEGRLVVDAPDFHHPGIELENKERAVILFKAIDQLPENQKSAFVLHKVEGLSYQEISEVLQVSVSSIESLMHRAKQNLKSILGNYYEENEK